MTIYLADLAVLALVIYSLCRIISLSLRIRSRHRVIQRVGQEHLIYPEPGWEELPVTNEPRCDSTPTAAQLVESVRVHTEPLPPARIDPGVIALELRGYAEHLRGDRREEPYRFRVTPRDVQADVCVLVGYRPDGTLDWEDGAARASELADEYRYTPTPEPAPARPSFPVTDFRRVRPDEDEVRTLAEADILNMSLSEYEHYRELLLHWKVINE